MSPETKDQRLKAIERKIKKLTKIADNPPSVPNCGVYP